MKTGRTLQELAAEITRQNYTKKDFVASTRSMGVVPIENNVALRVGDKGEYPIGKIAHGQIATHTKIDGRYYERMRSEGETKLLANNIERWFQKYPATRMVRTLDGGNRAFLSDTFQTFDNFDFAGAALPILHDRKLDVCSCEVTEKKLYIKAIDQQLHRDVPVGYRMGDGSHRIFETCAPVVALSNSEVGFGFLEIETGVYTSACTNLAMFAKGGMKRRHVGARHHLAEGLDAEDFESLLSNAAKKKTMEALWLQVRDVIAAAFNRDIFEKRCEQLSATSENKITGNVEKVIEVVQERFGLNEAERGSVLRHLIEGGSLSQFGLHAAVTRAAADVESYDRATELEYLGGRIVELPRAEWQQLAEAA